MGEIRARIGPGRFQWVCGAWFGAIIGSSLWLLVCSGLLVTVDLRLAGVMLGAFLATFTFGVWLWKMRGRIAPFPAAQAYLAEAGGVALLAFLCLHRAGLFERFEPGLRNPWTLYFVLAIYPGLMIQFAVIEYAARRRNGDGAGATGTEDDPDSGERRNDP